MSDEFWESLSRGRCMPMRAQGRSMLPAYPPGTMFLIEPVTVEALALGDLVLMRNDQDVRLHRLVGWTTGGEPLTKGDWCEALDAVWPVTSVRGRAVWAAGVDGGDSAATRWREVRGGALRATLCRLGGPALRWGRRARRLGVVRRASDRLADHVFHRQAGSDRR